VAGILFGMILGFFKALVVSDGSADVEGELGVNNMVDSISKGGKAVKEDNFIMFERRAGIVDWDDLQNMMVDGVAFFKGYIHIRVVRVNVIIYKGGNNEVASRGVRDRDLVEVGGKQII
jgi:hypothetical protein